MKTNNRKKSRRAEATWAHTHQHWGTRHRRLVLLLCSTGSWRATYHSLDSAQCQRTFQWLQIGQIQNINLITLTLYLLCNQFCTLQSPLTSSHADAGYVCGDLHAIFTLLSIQQQVKASCTSRGELAEHDVLRHTLHGVALTMG